MSGVVEVVPAGITASATFACANAAYAAADSIGTAQAFTFTRSGVAIPAGTLIRVDTALIKSDQTSIPTGMTTLNLAPYNVTPPSALADNAAWTVPSGDLTAYLKVFSLGTAALDGGRLTWEQTYIGKDLVLGAGGAIYAYLVTVAALTGPPAAASYSIHLSGAVI